MKLLHLFNPQNLITKLLANDLETKSIFTGNYVAFSEFDRYAIRTLIKKINKPFKQIAEIGSWIGNGSTKTIVEEIRGEGVLYCIDHWRGNDNVRRHQDLVSNYDIFNTFKYQVSSYGGTEIVKPMVMSSRDAASVIGDRQFDLVFIDGTHSYDETISDIDLWLPKVASGGILCGHDCEARPDDLDRNKLWENRNIDTIEGNNIFSHVHPGTILAVDEKFKGSAHLFAEEIITLEDTLIGRSTIWDISI